FRGKRKISAGRVNGPAPELHSRGWRGVVEVFDCVSREEGDISSLRSPLGWSRFGPNPCPLPSQPVGLILSGCGKRGSGPNFPSFSSFVFPQTLRTYENFVSDPASLAQMFYVRQAA